MTMLYFTDRGSGPPLLLVHGLMVTGDMFDPVVDQFATRHRVIVPDLRGHGRSRALPPPYMVRQLAADLSRLLDHLGIESTGVLGYSQGGAVAQQLALDHPEQCRRLVLACTYAFNMATAREKIEGRFLPALVRMLGPRRLAKLAVSQGAKELGKGRADWLVAGSVYRRSRVPRSSLGARRIRRCRHTTRRCFTMQSLVLSSSSSMGRDTR